MYSKGKKIRNHMTSDENCGQFKVAKPTQDFEM
jgi:hypothetical protein